MSLTPLYPHGPSFRLKTVVENGREDVTKVEEVEDQRLLAALVASLDLKVCFAHSKFVISKSRLTLLLYFYFTTTSSSF